MPKRKTLIKFILDRTGSMSVIRDETIVGFNEYITTLRAGENQKNMTLSLMQFDTEGLDTLYEDAPLDEVELLTRSTYKPRANTNLYDAVGKGIRDLEKMLSKARSKPAVIFVVMTDGLENASREYSRKSIYDLIQEKTKEGWVFTYLSSEADAWADSAAMGIVPGNTAVYSRQRIGRAFTGAAEATVGYASAVVAGNSAMLADSVMDGHDFGEDDDEGDVVETDSVREAREEAREKARASRGQ